MQKDEQNIKANDKKELTIKQKIHLYLYRANQYGLIVTNYIKGKTNSFLDSLAFYLIIFGFLIFFLHKANLTLSENNFYNLAVAVGSIIGASIAILFLFSTFILQSTADLFSTQYLNKFVEDTKEKIIFWSLVCLALLSFLLPSFLQRNKLEILVIILLVSFYLIYFLYKELRKRLNPETTLKKIKLDTIEQLEKTNKKFKKLAKIQNKIFKYEQKDSKYSLDVQYKTYSNWHLMILENIKHLFEIGLRLLAKNEINSFNLSIKFIHDIQLKHLDLRNKSFIRKPYDFFGTYTFDDEDFTISILEYLQSIGNRIIQEKRKENIYYLLKIYESLLYNSLKIEYAENNLAACKENPLLSLILAYYIGFNEKLLESKESDWIWESIKSITKVSNSVLKKTINHFVNSQIKQMLNKISAYCFLEKKEAFLKEILSIYFAQLMISWDKYEYDHVFWKDLFNELKNNTILLSSINRLSMSTGDLFINFHQWQVNIINSIFEINEGKEQAEKLDKFIRLLKKWSDFLLDFARDTGLETNKVVLLIIQSIDTNLKIIYAIKNNKCHRS